MGGRTAHAAHLVHDDVVSALGELPGCFASSEPAADYMNRCRWE